MTEEGAQGRVAVADVVHSGVAKERAHPYVWPKRRRWHTAVWPMAHTAVAVAHTAVWPMTETL